MTVILYKVGDSLEDGSRSEAALARGHFVEED